MAQIGVRIVLSLPNGTACTAEMDQLFEKFKPACRASSSDLCEEDAQEAHGKEGEGGGIEDDRAGQQGQGQQLD